MHSGATSKVVHLADMTQVKELENDMFYTKLIKMTFQSVSEAKNRAIVLALLTCDYRRSSDNFVRFYT